MLTQPEATLDYLSAVISDPQQLSSSAGHDCPQGPFESLKQSTIMIVDDEEANIDIVAEHLQGDGYRNLVYTHDPFRARLLANRERPDLILLDIHMPRMNGFEVLQQIRSDEALCRTPVVILTSSTDEDEKVHALELGATDFLNKPIHRGELLARLRNILMAKGYQDHLRQYSEMLESAVRQRTRELETSRQDVIHCLARAAEFRDTDTGQHVIRVGRYCRVIGEVLGLDRGNLELLEQAAKLHDIGKIGIPDAILLKPGKLTADQIEAMQKHSNFGKKIIEGIANSELDQLRQHVEIGSTILHAGRSPLLQLAMKIALTHHERWDGTGYPLGLAGEDIPLEGRITAVADVFDALSAKRPYKPAFPLEKCLAIMTDGRGSHFDPQILDAFFSRRNDIIEIQISCADID